MTIAGKMASMMREELRRRGWLCKTCQHRERSSSRSTQCEQCERREQNHFERVHMGQPTQPTPHTTCDAIGCRRPPTRQSTTSPGIWWCDEHAARAVKRPPPVLPGADAPTTSYGCAVCSATPTRYGARSLHLCRDHWSKYADGSSWAHPSKIAGVKATQHLVDEPLGLAQLVSEELRRGPRCCVTCRGVYVEECMRCDTD
jgi:hypothetical protein